MQSSTTTTNNNNNLPIIHPTEPTTSTKKQTIENNDETTTDEIRLLFDEYEPKEIKHIIIENISVKVVCAKDQHPGALQSGMWLWPGAATLCYYILENCHPHQTSQWKSKIVELGAGAGLVSLFTAKLYQEQLVSDTSKTIEFLITDRDFTSLKICRQSIKENHFHKNISIKTKRLEFNDFLIGDGNNITRIQADLIIGSDLIYSSEVVKSLLATLKYGFDVPCMFILASSFRDPVTTSIIEQECKLLGNIQRKAQEYRGHLIEWFIIG
jgi:predicted nicotinamide N-methyase